MVSFKFLISYYNFVTEFNYFLFHFSGRQKYNISICPRAPLAELMKQVEEITEIPFSGQKLICQAKTLTSNDPYKTSLASCNLITGSKVMVLGRKTDPEKDESYQKIVAIEKNIMDMAQKFVDISKQVQEITHLPKEHHESALRDLEKRSKACSEQWMRSLESLDGIQLDDTQTLSKSKRKSVVNCANSYMDQADELIQQIKTLQSRV